MGSGSSIIRDCWLQQDSCPIGSVIGVGIIGVRPTLWIENCDSASIGNMFVENGGPYRSFQGCTITGGSAFTISGMTGHNFLPGDYVVINGAANNTNYNHKWRINSITANTVTINTPVSGNETGVYVTSLMACVLLGGGVNAAGGGVTESTIRGIFTNTGGRLIEGTVGIYACARENGGGGQYFVSGLIIADVYSDFGENDSLPTWPTDCGRQLGCGSNGYD